MQHKQNKFVKKVLLNKLRSQRWRNIILCLSFVVVFCTVFALIHPAITLDDNTQVHVHNDDCYTSKGEFICKVEDETSEQAAADRTETEEALIMQCLKRSMIPMHISIMPSIAEEIIKKILQISCIRIQYCMAASLSV